MKNTKRKLVNNEFRSIEYLKYANKVSNINSKKKKKVKNEMLYKNFYFS